MSDNGSQQKEVMIDNPCDLFNLPGKLYKYYKFDSEYNESRLTGNVYLASPLDFNDPCDCRLEVTNNAKAMGKDRQWLSVKMRELGYSEKEGAELAVSLLDGNEHLDEVYHRQLQKLGILCTTERFDNSLMWGYYANNDGFCIEYDRSGLLTSLVIGFINALDFDMTRFLYVTKGYWDSPARRCNDLYAKNYTKVEKLRLTDYVGRVVNPFLRDKSDIVKVNFLTNILLKRFAGGPISYSNSNEIICCYPTLFFDKSNDDSKKKYFVKTDAWKHEREFRIIVSLGGNKVVKLGCDIIKNVYLGCNTSKEKIIEIACILAKNGMNCGLHLMKRCSNCTLEGSELDYKAMLNGFERIEQSIKFIKKETGNASADT